jgi:hypothetical protein
MLSGSGSMTDVRSFLLNTWFLAQRFASGDGMELLMEADGAATNPKPARTRFLAQRIFDVVPSCPRVAAQISVKATFCSGVRTQV